MGKDLIVKKDVVINDSAIKVWDAITNPALTKKYMYNSEVISDWKNGSSIIWRDADSGKVHVKGIILEVESGRILRTKDLSIDSSLPDVESNYSYVTYELIEGNNKTKLKVTEDNFNGDKTRFEDSEKFWDTVLRGMKELLAT